MRILKDRRSSRDFLRTPRGIYWGWALLGGILLLFTINFPTIANAANGPAAARTTPTAPDVVSVQWNATPTNLSQGFWGADVRPFSALGSAQESWWQSSPLAVARWPGGAVADGYNYTTNVITKTDGGTYTPPVDEAQFIQWCEQVHCEAIFGVPAEIDQPATAAYYVAYTEQTLHFFPAYWEIGNEPGLWQEFGLPWSKWHLGADSTITPLDYAQVVHAYIAAMRSVDPTIRIIGLPGTGLGASKETTWLADTVALNGPNLSAVAIHVYSAGDGNGTPTLPEFFASLSGEGSIATRIPADRAAVAAACPSCGSLPIFITEFGSGNGGGMWDGYMKSYPNVPYMAASLVQALTQDVANVDLFAFQSTYPGSLYTVSGTESPIGELYEFVLPQLGDEYVPTTVSSSVPGLYAAATLSGQGSAAELLLINTNASSAITVPVAEAGFPQGGSAQEIIWNQSVPSPVSQSLLNGVGPSVTLPPISLALIRAQWDLQSPPPIEYAVTFTESGLPSSSPWLVQIDGASDSSAGSSVETELSNGSYPFIVVAPSGYSATPSSGTVLVQGGSVAVPVLFSPSSASPTDYRVQFTSRGAASNADWAVQIADLFANGTGTLSFSLPNGSYGFSVTPPAGYVATPSSGSVSIAGSNVSVPIIFGSIGLGNYSVTFRQSGLGSGIPWWVSLNDSDPVNLTSQGPTIVLQLPNGSYRYSVGAQSGYIPEHAAGQFSVVGAASSIVVTFEHLNSSSSTPPGFYGLLPPLSPGSLNWYVIGLVGAVAVWLIGMVDFFVVRLGADSARRSRVSSGRGVTYPPR
jgi:hypothetical protein